MNHRLAPLANPYFVLSLFILLVNDFFLKYEYHNWITGKLSDVVGLFVFAYFWATVFPNKKKYVYFLTGITFVYWKSAYSEPLIIFFSNNIYSINRTKDVTDLLALFVLPISYSLNFGSWTKTKIVSIPIGLLAIFSFCATTVPKPTQTFDRPEYILFKGIDFEYTDNYPNEFKVYQFDSMEVVGVSRIEIDRFPAMHDDYHKSQILADLDLRVLCVSNREDRIVDLSSYRSLRDSLAIVGNTSITLDLDSVSDELNFRGTRLDGKYRRYSKERQLLIDGRYKLGIPDSIWNFYNVDKNYRTRQYFSEGEVTKIERIEHENIVTTDVNTRKDAVTKQYLFLTTISAFMIMIVIRLYINFRDAEKKSSFSIPHFAKVIQIILLPTIIFTFAKVISGFFSESHSDMFQFFAEFMLTNIILMPMLGFVHYALRLRSWLNLILYILLFTFALVWIEEFLFLKEILHSR